MKKDDMDFLRRTSKLQAGINFLGFLLVAFTIVFQPVLFYFGIEYTVLMLAVYAVVVVIFAFRLGKMAKIYRRWYH